MKATDVIKRDHNAVKEMWSKFLSASQEEQESMQKEIFRALTVHERIEDKHFYPAVREKMIGSQALKDIEMEQKKLEVEVLGSKLLPGDKEKRLENIMKTVLAHAEKEERTILPQAEELLGAKRLEEIGQMMEEDSAVEKVEE